MASLVREGVALGYEETGAGTPALVFVHGLACHRGFWAPQFHHFARNHRVIAVDLRGHGESDAPEQAYTIRGFADDLAWMSEQLEISGPVVVGHSLGGLVALELTGAHPGCAAAVVLIDSVLLPPVSRPGVVHELVRGLRGPEPALALRSYFDVFFTRADDPRRKRWILDEAVETPAHVTSSVWEESTTWDDAAALGRCHCPLLYLDAGTPNADLRRAVQIRPEIVLGRTVCSGHFSQLEVPDQVNAMLERFCSVALPAG